MVQASSLCAQIIDWTGIPHYIEHATLELYRCRCCSLGASSICCGQWHRIGTTYVFLSFLSFSPLSTTQPLRTGGFISSILLFLLGPGRLERSAYNLRTPAPLVMQAAKGKNVALKDLGDLNAGLDDHWQNCTCGSGDYRSSRRLGCKPSALPTLPSPCNKYILDQTMCFATTTSSKTATTSTSTSTTTTTTSTTTTTTTGLGGERRVRPDRRRNQLGVRCRRVQVPIHKHPDHNNPLPPWNRPRNPQCGAGWWMLGVRCWPAPQQPTQQQRRHFCFFEKRYGGGTAPRLIIKGNVAVPCYTAHHVITRQRCQNTIKLLFYGKTTMQLTHSKRYTTALQARTSVATV